ncbi:ParB/RepB/Spo0J family partition protein [Sphingomonas sp.]|jgi:ParB family chromosome partitioning protein|uniref:ParB/RepB/Spo0J family partition protein n=1 Tax=Sphingomonas sp. TaxID=28214 RepID=UPI002ED7C4D3
MKLDHIELERLSISPLNMRAKKAPDLANILPSVRERGILVPLLVRPGGETGCYEIVAGRRRFLAASAIAGETGQFAPLPCAIMEEGDDAAALEASLIENFARLDPDEVTQWETFVRLIRDGRSIEDIAATFGITERLVRRILALGNLLPRIRSLYRQDNVDDATVRHLTMATKAQQKEWLALYDSPDNYAPTGQRLKEWLCGGELIATRVALFDLADYKGPIVSDLFGEDSYFVDPQAFWTLQREAIEAKRQGYLEDGWAGVELIEPGGYFQKWEYEKRSKDRKGRIYIALSARGEVEIHDGFVQRREASRQERSESGTKVNRSEVTSALRNYLDLHRHAAVRARLVNQPGLALRLMIAHAITNSGLWMVKVDPQRADKPATAESIETSQGEALFDEKRRTAIALLGLDAEALTFVDAARHAGTMQLYEHLAGLSDEAVLEMAAVVMGETLETGSSVVDGLGTVLSVDMTSLWQADEAFFDLIRDKQVLGAIVAEVAGTETASANAGETGKVLKGIIRDCLTGDSGRKKVEHWVPKWLLFPAASYRPQSEKEADEGEAEGTGIEQEAV